MNIDSTSSKLYDCFSILIRPFADIIAPLCGLRPPDAHERSRSVKPRQSPKAQHLENGARLRAFSLAGQTTYLSLKFLPIIKVVWPARLTCTIAERSEPSNRDIIILCMRNIEIQAFAWMPITIRSSSS